MSKRENDAVAAILADPENIQSSAEEIADRVIDALDDVRSRTHRLAVVGQIWHTEAQERPETVILGPFSARGILDTPDKFLKATEGGSAARQAGQDLAWDTKTGRGRGRFMLAPAFSRPRDAWDFFRPPPGPGKKGAMDFLHEPPAHIAESVQRWTAGLWAEEHGLPPGCLCGMGEARLKAAEGYTRFGIPTNWCERHQSATVIRERPA